MLLFFLVFSFFGNAIEASLIDRIALEDKRYPTFQYALELMEERKARTIVETGTARDGARRCRGDGCSTLTWGEWALQFGATVYTVDIDPCALTESRAASHAFPTIEFCCDDSVHFLETFQGKIDFLYLDSFDFDLNNPSPSQQHHLKEIIAAYPHLHANSIVMIDDCDLPYGGKGNLVIEYLLEKGWKIALSHYQVILLYPREEI